MVIYILAPYSSFGGLCTDNNDNVVIMMMVMRSAWNGLNGHFY